MNLYLQSKIMGYHYASRIHKYYQDKKIVFTNGCFDILHIGHINFLNAAAKLGDILIVGIYSDRAITELKGVNRPVNTAVDRCNIIASLSCVDHVIEFDDISPLKLIKTIKPNILVKGADYTVEQMTGSEYVKSYGGKVVTVALTEGKSTSMTILKILNSENNKEKNSVRPFIRVLGSSDWEITKENDGASYTLNDNMLIDSGWSGVGNLLNLDICPTNINLVLFTHMHIDHCMSLPQIIMYWIIKKKSLKGLTLAGPLATLSTVYKKSIDFLFPSSDKNNQNEFTSFADVPNFIDTTINNQFMFSNYLIQSHISDHTVEGLCYRITDLSTGHVVGITGDTCYCKSLEIFFKGCDMLIHEATNGITSSKESYDVYKHSSVFDAIELGDKAEVKKILLTHAQLALKDGIINTARSHTDISIDWAMAKSVYPF